MKGLAYLLVAVVALTGAVIYVAQASERSDGQADPVFGINIPSGYRDWKLISVAHEEGNLKDLRALLGNDVAIEAYREGRSPFPDGTIIARLPGVTFRPRKTTKSLAAPNLSWPDPPRTFSLWSRTPRNTLRRVVGGLLNSKTANLRTRRCSKPAFLATSLSRLVTLSSLFMHREYAEIP